MSECAHTKYFFRYLGDRNCELTGITEFYPMDALVFVEIWSVRFGATGWVHASRVGVSRVKMRANNSVFILALLIAGDNYVSAIDSSNVIFIIVSQPEAYHAGVAMHLKQDIQRQVLEIGHMSPKIHLTHEDFPIRGAWTIYPLLPKLIADYKGIDVRWVVFLETHTAVNYKILLNVLNETDDDKEAMWIGYPLSDEEPTIIHHFQFYEELDEDHGGFVYPYFAAGFAMRVELIKQLTENIKSGQTKLEAEFSIDPAFELAQLVFGDGSGPLMTPDLRFCVVAGDNCATYPKKYDLCDSPVPEESIFFAVKTWSGFHESRAKVVKKTWGKYVSNIMFFSDKQDQTLPSINLGVPNAKSGHCTKTVEILKYVGNLVRSMPEIQWVFLADDDTILGVQRLCEVLSCLRGGTEMTIGGERYGYGYGKKETANKGYDFITGGGGTLLSVSAVLKLSTCTCASYTAPDDMTLGACAVFIHNLTMTHIPLFHQNRPQDYPREHLSRDRPVSFHRHSSPEPNRVYSTWFLSDHKLPKKRHDEL